jgi:hypothetical protein
VLDIAKHPAPPLRLRLGSDCVARVEAKLGSVREELERWRATAMSTDFDD